MNCTSSGANPGVTTLAGNGNLGHVDGAGGRTGVAEFDDSFDLAVDHQGNVFVADTYNNLIRKIDPSGYVTTFAGNGIAGYDDAPGAYAEFSMPQGIAVDGQGNLYVSDNHSIRKIDPSGNVTTLAGTGRSGFTDGPGTQAQFYNPAGLAVDGQGNVFVADNDNNRIRKVDPSGFVTTVAGNGQLGRVDGTGGYDGTAQFYDPTSVVVDGQGNLYVMEDGDWVRKIDPNGNVTSLNVQAAEGMLALDRQGNLYLTDENAHHIIKADPNGNVTVLAGNGIGQFADGTLGPSGTAEFRTPAGITVDDCGTVYVTDTSDNSVRKIVP
jgi:streptogramin lyase